MLGLMPRAAFTSKQSKWRVSIASITLTVMQGPRDMTFPFGDFHTVHRGTSGEVSPKVQVQGTCVVGKAKSRVTAALISFTLTNPYGVSTMCQNLGLTPLSWILL